MQTRSVPCSAASGTANSLPRDTPTRLIFRAARYRPHSRRGRASAEESLPIPRSAGMEWFAALAKPCCIFQRAQTVRKFLAAAVKVAENSYCTDEIRWASPLLASAQQPHVNMSTTLNLVSEMERIASALGAETGGAPGVSLSVVAEKIAKNLGVRNDEVAILAVSTRWRHLHFLVPEALKNIGFVPLSSNSALSARTARESRPEIENNFASTRHATIFESVKVAPDDGGTIQKMV